MPDRHPPYAVAGVRNAAVDALLCGSAGWLSVPAGGTVRIDWRERAGCYRLTIDLRAGNPLDLAAALEWLPRLATINEGMPPLKPDHVTVVGRDDTAARELTA